MKISGRKRLINNIQICNICNIQMFYSNPVIFKYEVKIGDVKELIYLC